MPLNLILIIFSAFFIAASNASNLDRINNLSLGLVVNMANPQSVALAKYYQQKRLIPDENIIRIYFKNNTSTLTADEFENIQYQLKKAVADHIQAYALAWSRPYRVDCMSITTAFTLGYDKKYCATDCKTTQTSPYFNSASQHPFTDFNLRPSMMLAGYTLNTIKKMIDRGVQADYSRPKAKAYLLNTSDKNRNVRSVYFSTIEKTLTAIVNVITLKKDYIVNKKDILFYFTGSVKVPQLNSNHFLPGAVADHLTSSGGQLFQHHQMSILNWLEAGATASYGAVVEPCNFLSKFPNPSFLMNHYLNGDTVIEAYWKSVSMPGQGVFVGEPLASPFKNCRIQINKFGYFNFIQPIVNNYVMRDATRC